MKGASSFLLSIMPVMFIPPTVGLMDAFSLLHGSLAAYFIGLHVRKKTGFARFHPLLVAICLIIALLSVLKIDYSAYNQGAKLLSFLL